MTNLAKNIDDMPLGDPSTLHVAVEELETIGMHPAVRLRIIKLMVAVHWQGITEGLEVAAMGDGPPPL